jgi:fibronectin type 3 domain-containing protein
MGQNTLSGQGTIAVANFIALNPGNTSLQLSNFTLSNSDLETIPVDLGDNASVTVMAECQEVTDLSARAKSSKVQLTWTHVGVDSYNVYRKVEGGEYSLLANTTSTYSTYLDTAVTNGTTYYYVVNSVCNGSESEASNEASATPTSRRRR